MITLRKKTCFTDTYILKITNTYAYFYHKGNQIIQYPKLYIKLSNPLRQVQRIHSYNNTIYIPNAFFFTIT